MKTAREVMWGVVRVVAVLTVAGAVMAALQWWFTWPLYDAYEDLWRDVGVF